MNSIHVILPYKYGSQWVFDDPRHGLSREPFVSGADDIVNTLARGADSIMLLFSDTPFADFEYQFDWQSHHSNGDWYTNAEMGTGWLCPALLKYFKTAPERIYVKVKR